MGHGYIVVSQREAGGESLGRALNHPFLRPIAGHTCLQRATMSPSQGLGPLHPTQDGQENHGRVRNLLPAGWVRKSVFVHCRSDEGLG